MTRTLAVLTVVVVAIAAAGVAHAQSVSWKYAEGGWINLDPDGGDSENGWFLGGAYEFGTDVRIHVFAEFADVGPLDQFQLGAGWHGLLGERADLFADGAYYDVDVDDGFRVRGGVRWMVLKRLELNGYLALSTLDYYNEQSLAANAIFDFTRRFGVGGGFEWGDEVTATRVFVRFNFGPRN
jgi:hypothetical protein